MLRSVVSRVRPRAGLRMAQSLRTYSTQGSAAQGSSASNGKTSLKDLMKRYGWAAFGVYMTIGAIDLPLSFVIVHSLGQDRVTEMERSVRGFFGMSTKDEDLKTISKAPQDGSGESETNWGLLLTELGIAYAIHKSVFLFVRVPATAAITPWAVKKLRQYGFSIGGKKAVSSSASKAVGTGVTKEGKNLGTTPTQRQRWWWFF
ncbi:hypothetical protein TRVA0_012S00430 [Trichomonascus vanleenenianus]|uniref:Nat2p n=1 Tax=Trichomonascus vanleenenianus TaxID=2268995 RepID=UPI003EC9F22A